MSVNCAYITWIAYVQVVAVAAVTAPRVLEFNQLNMNAVKQKKHSHTHIPLTVNIEAIPFNINSELLCNILMLWFRTSPCALV